MPRYFFDTIDGGRVDDDMGTDLPNDAAARVHAIKYAGEVLSSDPKVLWDGSEFKVCVENANRQRLFTLVCYIDEDAERTSH